MFKSTRTVTSHADRRVIILSLVDLAALLGVPQAFALLTTNPVLHTRLRVVTPSRVHHSFGRRLNGECARVLIYTLLTQVSWIISFLPPILMLHHRLWSNMVVYKLKRKTVAILAY